MNKPKRLILTTITVVLFSISNIFSQNSSSIKGTVKDQQGVGLLGATAQLLNTNYAVTTDMNGVFEIKNIAAGSYVLEVRYIGFKTLTQKIVLTQNKETYVALELEEDVNALDEVYVRGATLRTEKSTSKIDVITNADIKNLVVEQPLRILEQVPGVNVVAYGQGGVADQFSMRGFGSGGHGGQAGVEIDGVSLNEAEGHADGYADLNILIPLNISKVKVYKGPTSALYGRFAQGGTITLETRKGGEYNDLRMSGGAFNTFDTQYAQGKTIALNNKRDLSTNFAVQLFTTEGYIENSDILKGNVSGRIAYELSDNSEIAVSIIGHKSEWNAPGYITQEQYLNEELRNKPAPTAENDGGRKTFLSERVDFNHKISDNLKLLVFGYALQQDFTRYTKFAYEPTGQSEAFNTRNVYALGASLNGSTQLADKDFAWATGIELYSEKTDRERWDTAFRERLDQTQARIFDVQSFSAYAQGEWDLHRLFKPSVGLRFDVFGGEFKNNDPGSTPFTGEIDGLSNIAPKLGFRSTLVNDFDFHANVSNGFSLPNSNLKYLEDSDLDPISLWQYEAGFTYDNRKGAFFNVTGFILNSSNEVLERPFGSGNYVNAGETRRSGIEADARFNITNDFLVRGNFTFTDTEIITGPNEGNSLAQVPETMVNLGATYTSPIGLGADVLFRNVADYYTDDDNAFKDGGYSITNFTLFYNFDKLFSSKGRVFLTANNLFDEKYAETVFGTTLYAASPTRNISLGINYSF